MFEIFIPTTFLYALATLLVVLSILFYLVSFLLKDKSSINKFIGLLFVSAFCLFANNYWTYLISIFIIATTVTELSFLENLAAIFRGNKEYWDYKKSTQGQTSKENAESIKENSKTNRSRMEFMILNTLWTKQVNKWPDLSQLFTFVIQFENYLDTQEFRIAGAKLIGEGLIAETTNGHYLLTKEGFEFCKSNFKKFPPDQWWPDEQINQEKLKSVLGE